MEQELDLLALWQVIAKRWKLIVLIPLAAAVISILYSSYMITPLYKSSTTLLVMRPTDARDIYWQDLHVSRQLAETYSDIVLSRRVMTAAVAKEDWPYEIDELAAMITAEGVRDTEIIKLSATNPHPEVARDVANVVAAAFKEEIIEIMNVENVSTLDEAVAPGGPVSPRIHLNVAVAFVVGLMGAFGLVFLLEYLDRTVKDPAEAQAIFNLPVIGTIPMADGDSLFASSNPRSPPAEALRTLRTNIQYSSVDRPIKRLLVTAANPQCGKSTVAANLGLTLAGSGGSVLLVDADLRRPTQHEIFGIESEPGLTSLIVKDELDLGAVMHRSGHDNLTIIPSGPVPPYPSEMLASLRMYELVKSFTDHFDYVIFDSPPVVAVTDAAVLSRVADGTLLVIGYGKVNREEVSGALEQMSNVQANMIGLVINGMPHSKTYYNGYSYYYGSDRNMDSKGKSFFAGLF